MRVPVPFDPLTFRGGAARPVINVRPASIPPPPVGRTGLLALEAPSTVVGLGDADSS
jgi:hypothetical protein